jgi:hypothetical protein
VSYSTICPAAITATWSALRANAVDVRDQDGRAALDQPLEPGHHLGFALGVETGRRLVEHEHGWVPQQDARDADPLTLAAREADAPRAEHGVETLGQGLDEREGAGCLGDVPDHRHVGVGPVGDVVPDTAAEEDRVLEQDADLVAHPAQGPLPGVAAIDPDGAV